MNGNGLTRRVPWRPHISMLVDGAGDRLMPSTYEGFEVAGYLITWSGKVETTQL